MMMKDFRIGIIRVITLKREEEINRHGKMIEEAFPNFRTVSRCIEKQPRGIFDEKSEDEAVPKIIRVAKQLLNENVDGIIVSCVADPAVNAIQTFSKKPVVGAGKPTALLALSVSDKVGALGIGDEPPKPVSEILKGRLISYRKPRGVSATIDLERNIEFAVEAAEQLIRDGAQVIALCCTGFSTIGLAPILQEKLRIPVIDPIIAAGTIMYHELIRTFMLRSLWEVG